MFLFKYMGYSGFTNCQTSQLEIEGVIILFQDNLC